MSFSADISQLEELYLKHGEGMFALCFLYTGKAGPAFALMRTALSDITYSKKQWRLASSGEEGFYRAVYRSCMDYYEKNPSGKPRKRLFKKKKKEESPSFSRSPLPFSLTDPLRAILCLPAKCKAPLYLLLGKKWDPEKAAKCLGGSPRRFQPFIAAALKKLDMPQERCSAALKSISVGRDTLNAIWEHFLTDMDQQGFEDKQRLRRFKRWMDNAVPFIALAAVAFCALAYFGVEYGWFSGTPYSQTAPIDGYVPSGENSTPEEYQRGSVSVFVPEENGFAEYIVRNTPLSPEALTRQMVLLGGLPEMSALLSVDTTSLQGKTTALRLEFSKEAADFFEAASSTDALAMLKAMTYTYKAAFEGLESISLTSDGVQLTAEGKTAQDLLSEKIEPDRKTETEYRE